jgi:hypothetical protein
MTECARQVLKQPPTSSAAATGDKSGCLVAARAAGINPSVRPLRFVRLRQFLKPSLESLSGRNKEVGETLIALCD